MRTDLRPEMRQKVLDAAARLFREKGYAGTTMREVADRCGIRAASLYYHFPSKDEILAEVFDYGVRHVADAVRAAVDELPPSASSYEKVRAAVRAHLESFFVYGDYTATNIRVFRQAPREVQQRNRSLRDRYEGYWQTLLEEARHRGEIRKGVDLAIARLFLFGGLNHTLEWYTHRGASFRELAGRYADLIFHGIGRNAGASA
jgi:TetR/AcrR family transcriptional regulator, cholesterol catabolism regulator